MRRRLQGGINTSSFGFQLNFRNHRKIVVVDGTAYVSDPLADVVHVEPQRVAKAVHEIFAAGGVVGILLFHLAGLE